MNYNLKNKYIVIIALSFAVTMAMGRVCYAEDTATPAPETPAVEDIASVDTENSEKIADIEDDSSFLDDISDEKADTDTADAEADSNSNIKVKVSAADHVAPANDFLNTDDVDEDLDVSDVDDSISPEDDSRDDLLAPMEGFDEDEEDSITASQSMSSNKSSSKSSDKKSPQLEMNDTDSLTTPNSPFENFGNAILSKVDNDLFNQMSNIEKQTTILNLELKREELKNRVEALRNARQQARFEAEARRLAEEQKIKDMEAARKEKLIAAQEKLKEKEIELEKVRQNKLLNDYMNEMLLMNQGWIEKNTQLQARISELENERKELISTVEAKLVDVQTKAEALSEVAKTAIQNHQKLLASLNAQIKQLKKDILDSEMRMRDMKSSAAAAASSGANPFASAGVGNLAPTAHSIDISEEYAIMDITGKGDDIVAKIVNREGTTFTIHRGSVLKGGQVVLSITEKYIAFDSNGSKTYLYPGGSIMEYEPRATFSDSEKMQESIEKQPMVPMTTELRSGASNIKTGGAEVQQAPLGQSKMVPDNSKSPKPARNKKTVTTSSSGGSKSGASKSMSFSQGMYVH